MFALGMTMSPEMGQAVDGALDHLHETMAPWAGEGGYFNFAERACDVDEILSADTCRRLGEVKRKLGSGRHDPLQPRARAGDRLTGPRRAR